MRKNIEIESVHRIIDANINRAKEGLRVSEEIARFVLNDRGLTQSLKKIRHDIDAITRTLGSSDLLKARSSAKDVGRTVYGKELKREGLCGIFLANIQRTKESIRVLEEFSKIINVKLAVKLKNMRYGVYEAEKKIAKKLSQR